MFIDRFIAVYEHNTHAKGVEELDRSTFELDDNESFEFYDQSNGWVLLDHNKVVGFCLYEVISPTSWYFSNLAIAPEYKRKGYGTQLLERLINVADEKSIVLTTRAYKGYDHLIRLYSKYGFELQLNSESRLGSPLMIRLPISTALNTSDISDCT